MEHNNSERRKSANSPTFPFIDSKGCQVTHDRRGRHDRRKNKRGSDVAGKILKILN